MHACPEYGRRSVIENALCIIEVVHRAFFAKKGVEVMPETHLSEPQKIIADITLMNNCFMNKVIANDVASTQLLLRIILNNDKINVKTVNTQQFIQNLYGHSAQLDI